MHHCTVTLCSGICARECVLVWVVAEEYLGGFTQTQTQDRDRDRQSDKQTSKSQTTTSTSFWRVTSNRTPFHGRWQIALLCECLQSAQPEQQQQQQHKPPSHTYTHTHTYTWKERDSRAERSAKTKCNKIRKNNKTIFGWCSASETFGCHRSVDGRLERGRYWGGQWQWQWQGGAGAMAVAMGHSQGLHSVLFKN